MRVSKGQVEGGVRRMEREWPRICVCVCVSGSVCERERERESVWPSEHRAEPGVRIQARGGRERVYKWRAALTD